MEFALEEFFLDTGRYPTAQEGLAALFSADPDLDDVAVADWRGPYLDLSRVPFHWSQEEGELTDVRGHPLAYAVDEDQDRVLLRAAGPDGRLEPWNRSDPAPGGDDVIIWVEGP